MDWIGSAKMDPCPTLTWILISLCTGGVRHLYHNNNCLTQQTKLRLRFTR